MICISLAKHDELSPQRLVTQYSSALSHHMGSNTRQLPPKQVWRLLMHVFTRPVIFILSHGPCGQGPCAAITEQPTSTLLSSVTLQNRTTCMLINSPLASHRVKLSDIMDTPVRNIKLPQRMDTFLVFSEFLLGGTAKIQVGHSYRT